MEIKSVKKLQKGGYAWGAPMYNIKRVDKVPYEQYKDPDGYWTADVYTLWNEDAVMDEAYNEFISNREKYDPNYKPEFVEPITKPAAPAPKSVWKYNANNPYASYTNDQWTAMTDDQIKGLDRNGRAAFQTYLKDVRGYDIGKSGVDGLIGRDTLTAMGSWRTNNTNRASLNLPAIDPAKATRPLTAQEKAQKILYGSGTVQEEWQNAKNTRIATNPIATTQSASTITRPEPTAHVYTNQEKRALRRDARDQYRQTISNINNK